jgi:hypothetical protein
MEQVIDWAKEAEIKKRELNGCEKWMESNWANIPKEVHAVIIRGVLKTEEKIEKYQEFAKKYQAE